MTSEKGTQIMGQRVEELRRLRGWKLATLAHKANTSSDKIRRIEFDRWPEAPAALLGRIAQALNTSADYLLGLSDCMGSIEDKVEKEDPESAALVRKLLETFPRLSPRQREFVACAGGCARAADPA